MPRYVHRHREGLEPSFFMKCLKTLLGAALIAATVLGIAGLATVAPIGITLAAASIALIIGGGFLLPWLFRSLTAVNNNGPWIQAPIAAAPIFRQEHGWQGYGLLNHGAHAFVQNPQMHGHGAPGNQAQVIHTRNQPPFTPTAVVQQNPGLHNAQQYHGHNSVTQRTRHEALPQTFNQAPTQNYSHAHNHGLFQQAAPNRDAESRQGQHHHRISHGHH